MSRVFWDTNLFIYLLESHPVFGASTASLLTRLRSRGDELLTSSMTLGELQVRPRRLGLFQLADQYRQTISNQCTIVTFTETTADRFAEIRENPAISSPDAIQLSCAATAGVDFFITNDRALQKLSIPGIGDVVSLDRSPL